MFIFNKSELAALLPTMAKKDIRTYLVGGLFEVCANGDVHLVSTDGNAAFVGRIPEGEAKRRWEGGVHKGPMRIMIPRGAIEAAIKAATDNVEMTALDDGRYTLGATVFTPLDGRFPDWRLIAPNPTPTTPGTGGDFEFFLDPAIAGRASEGLRLWHGGKKGAPANQVPGGGGPATLTWPGKGKGKGKDEEVEVANAFALVMPIRVKKEAVKARFSPASYE